MDEPALLVTLPRGADPAPLLDIQATTLRVLDGELQQYLLFELRSSSTEAVEVACPGGARIEAVWLLGSDLDGDGASSHLSVWDPSTGIRHYHIAPRKRSSLNGEPGSRDYPGERPMSLDDQREQAWQERSR